MASFTLDEIRDAADKKYGSTDIRVGDETVRLLNPIRLPKDRRDALFAKQEELGSDDADANQEQILRDCIRIVAERDYQADALLNAIGDDLGVLMAVFESYLDKEEAGEASASAA